MKGSGHTNGLLHRELPKPSKELVGVKTHDELLRLLLARQQEVVSGAGTDPAADLRRQEEEGALSPKSAYQKNKVAREQLSLQLLMHLNGEQMASIKAEFHAHDDEVDLEDFCAIMERHKPENLTVDRGGGGGGGGSENNDAKGDGGSARWGDESGANDGGGGSGGGGGAGAGAGKVVVSRQEVISNLVELFKEVDINGDGMMEWDEFTRFVVVKAQLHHAQMSIDQLAEYRQGLKQVEVASYNRSCGAVEQLCYIPGSHQVAAIQEHNPIVNLYNSHTWTRVAQLKHNAVPLAMAYCGNHHTLVTASADMTLLQWHLDDIPAIKHFTLKSRWPTKHAAMSMCWSSSHRLLYSGTTAGTIQGWDIGERQEMVTLKGHSDIVMGMMVMRSLDNLVSASLDTSIRVWDTYTQKPVHTLLGHNKGVHSLTYSSQYRCLISAGFDHEAHVWSPFVNSLLNKLKGHHASLVGCQAVEGTPELITADSSGVVKLWDLRTFHCVQTFQADNDGELPRDKASTSCFVHFKVPPTRSNQEQDDHRLVLARGKRLLPFDQYRCKTEAITDDFVVTCACFNHTSLNILTATERTVKIWDAVGGILKGVFKGITDADITAVCLDDRERKFILGNARGEVAVYNFRNGAKMKDLDTQAGPIAGLVYCEQEKAVLVACQDGDMVCFDEMDPDKAALLVTFEGGGSAYSDDLNNVAYSHKNGLVATSSCNPEDGIIIWGFGTGRQDHVLAHGKAEGLVSSVAALLFLDPYPLLLATYADGAIRVWGVKGSPLKGLLVLTFPNQAPTEAYFWGDEEAEYPLLRYEPSAAELAAAGKAPTTADADGDRETGQASRENGQVEIEAPGATEQPTTEDAGAASSAKGQSSRKKSRGNADTGLATELREKEEEGGEEDDEHKFSEWKVHPRWTPRKDIALQVLSTQWHSKTACLFTGDETGRLRCWSLQRVLEALGVDPVREVAVGYADSYRGGNRTQGGMGASRTDSAETNNEKEMHGARRGSMLQRIGSTTTMTTKQISSDMVDFRWGAEGAHEDAIGLVVLVPTDPPALLTSGGDRCVKAWTLDGRPQGMLLQGLAPHAPNPRWSFSVNVEAMAHAEVSEAKTVLARIDERRASKMAAAAQAAEEGAMFPDPVSQHRSHHHHNHHHHRHHHHHHRPKRRSSGSGTLPPAEASPLKQAQLLRQRKESTAAAAAAAQGVAEKASHGGRKEAGGLAVSQVEETRKRGERREDDREGGGSIGGSAFRGDARSMALEAASEGLGGYSRSSCSSEGTSCSTSSRGLGGRHTDRPSVVPPSPGRRRGGTGAGISSIVERMGKLLDEAETFSDAHTNRFGGRRSNVSDFIKGAVVEDPRRDNGSIRSGSSGTTLGPGSGTGNLELRDQR